jgi:hypothetical protein
MKQIRNNRHLTVMKRKIVEAFNRIVDARVPLCVWLDFATLDLYRTRL